MTAHELARLLLRGPDLPLRVAQPTHDHWDTMLAVPVREVAQGEIIKDDYHDTDCVLDDAGAREQGRAAILLWCGGSRA